MRMYVLEDKHTERQHANIVDHVCIVRVGSIKAAAILVLEM
jgi:hypothetical protein